MPPAPPSFSQLEMMGNLQQVIGMKSQIQEDLVKIIQRSAPPVMKDSLMATAQLLTSQMDDLLNQLAPGSALAQEDPMKPAMVQAKVVLPEQQAPEQEQE